MSKIFKILFIAFIGISISKCSKSGTTDNPVVLNDYTTQRDADNTKIVTYLKTHKMTQVGANYDVVFETVTNQANSIWGAGTTPNANVLTRTCTANSITYKIYYIQLNQGVNTNNIPCNLDAVWAAYKGRLMDEYIPVGTIVNGVATTVATGGASVNDIGTVFDSNANPNSFFNLDQVIRGWSEVFPQFAPGNYTANGDGTNTYSDFGAGVMFIPSGLAYFNGAPGSIPAYSPLIFNFKLYEIRRNDHDNDGIKDFNEDLDGDRYIYNTTENGAATVNIDDTDKDGVPDVYDIDDDEDHYLTRTEIKRPAIPGLYDSNGVPVNTGYYQFTPATINYANTPYDDTMPIPSCTDGKKNYLSNICH